MAEGQGSKENQVQTGSHHQELASQGNGHFLCCHVFPPEGFFLLFLLRV